MVCIYFLFFSILNSQHKIISYTLQPKSMTRSPTLSAASKRSNKQGGGGQGRSSDRKKESGRWSTSTGGNGKEGPPETPATELSSGDTGDDMLIGDLLCK